MSAHTPGPWEVEGRSGSGRLSTDENRAYHTIEAAPPNYIVADTMNRGHLVTPEEDAANARLIAAAPELLDLVKYVRNYAQLADLSEPTIQKLDAAIAKAEGRS